MIETFGLDREKALRDINYVLKNGKYVFDNNDFLGESFRNNPHFYLNCNDRVNNIVSFIVKEGDSVLTVLSGGEYLFDSILYGATKIVTYDINFFQYYIATLKMWALEELSYKEFIHFFTNVFSFDYFSPYLLERIIDNHKDEAVYTFWNVFLEKRKKEYGVVIKSLGNLPYNIRVEVMDALYKGSFDYVVGIAMAKAANPYEFGYLSSEENYDLVKKKINDVNISFVNVGIQNIGSKLEGLMFDDVFLSNIPTYLDSKLFVKAMNCELGPILNNNGSITSVNQGMRGIWFNDINKGCKPFIDPVDLGYGTSFCYDSNKRGVDCVINSYIELVNNGWDMDIESMYTYGGSLSMNPNTDVRTTFVKKKENR